MNAVVIYKSRYGSAKQYAEWIADELSCDIRNEKETKIGDILKYDTIIYGGGLYAEVIAGIGLITKNLDKLKTKKIAVFSTAITPLEYREYYDKYVIEKNFKQGVSENIKIFNFIGKMLLDELTPVHRTALKTLKKIMSGKENPTEMERLLVDLCDYNDNKMDKSYIKPLIDYVRE